MVPYFVSTVLADALKDSVVNMVMAAIAAAASLMSLFFMHVPFMVIPPFRFYYRMLVLRYTFLFGGFICFSVSHYAPLILAKSLQES